MLADKEDLLADVSKAFMDYGLNSVHNAEAAVWEYFTFTVLLSLCKDFRG